MSKPKFLIILTSQGIIPTNRAKTGWYLSEFAHPYSILSPHLSLTIASPEGGEAPLDPSSASKDILDNDPVSRGFLEQNRDLWTRTVPLRELVPRVTAGEFEGVFYVGGHGPKAMYDLPTHPSNLAILQSLAASSSNKIIAAVCHGPAALLNATTPSGIPLLAGSAVTGFSNEEEELVGMHHVMPFELQTELARVAGGSGGYVRAERAWGEKVVVSRTVAEGACLVTGQNPGSAGGVAKEVLKIMGIE